MTPQPRRSERIAAVRRQQQSSGSNTGEPTAILGDSDPQNQLTTDQVSVGSALSPKKSSRDGALDVDKENSGNTTSPLQEHHPNLVPILGQLVFDEDVSPLSFPERAALYSPDLRLRDEAIVSTYTDPVLHDLVENAPRVIQGRYYEFETLEQLLMHAGGGRDVVTNPLNQQEEWSVEQMFRAMSTSLSDADLAMIRAAHREYESRQDIREAWEAQRGTEQRTPQLSLAHERLVRGQRGTQPSIQELRREEASELHSAIAARLANALFVEEDIDELGPVTRAFVDLLRETTATTSGSVRVAVTPRFFELVGRELSFRSELNDSQPEDQGEGSEAQEE